MSDGSTGGFGVRATMTTMTWFFALVLVVVLGVIAVVASGRGGAMAETFDDRPDSRVQAEGPLTGDDLRRVRFSTALRGYRMSEVDALLDRLSAELELAYAGSAPRVTGAGATVDPDSGAGDDTPRDVRQHDAPDTSRDHPADPDADFRAPVTTPVPPPGSSTRDQPGEGGS